MGYKSNKCCCNEPPPPYYTMRGIEYPDMDDTSIGTIWNNCIDGEELDLLPFAAEHEWRSFDYSSLSTGIVATTGGYNLFITERDISGDIIRQSYPTLISTGTKRYLEVDPEHSNLIWSVSFSNSPYPGQMRVYVYDYETLSLVNSFTTVAQASSGSGSVFEGTSIRASGDTLVLTFAQVPGAGVGVPGSSVLARRYSSAGVLLDELTVGDIYLPLPLKKWMPHLSRHEMREVRHILYHVIPPNSITFDKWWVKVSIDDFSDASPIQWPHVAENWISRGGVNFDIFDPVSGTIFTRGTDYSTTSSASGSGVVVNTYTVPGESRGSVPYILRHYGSRAILRYPNTSKYHSVNTTDGSDIWRTGSGTTNIPPPHFPYFFTGASGSTMLGIKMYDLDGVKLLADNGVFDMNVFDHNNLGFIGITGQIGFNYANEHFGLQMSSNKKKL